MPAASRPKSRAHAVYQRVFASYLPRIAAVTNDLTLTLEQRQAVLAALHVEQQQTAEAAMERELNEETALAKSQKLRRQTARAWPKRRHQVRRHP
jgi:8-oxo-dGTP pyrophosphatase MutT (NUDIX family)